jgi:hypothetical protein
MHYEVNVSLRGRHLFATHARSATNEAEARRVYAHLRAAFPSRDGYDVDITRWEETGRNVTEEFERGLSSEGAVQQSDQRRFA